MVTKHESLDLHVLVEKGFPLTPLVRAKFDAGEAFEEMDLEIKFDSMGSSGNNWDDPGEAAEWHIERVWAVKGLELMFPLTEQQLDWLYSYELLSDSMQQWALDSSNWYDPYDDVRD